MDGLTVVKVRDCVPVLFAEENISGVILPQSDSASSSIGIIAPGATQTLHHHKRPDSGDEIIFTFKGSIVIVTANGASEVMDVGQIGPVYVSVKSGMAASLRNVGEGDARFFSVFAPPFSPGEIVYEQ